MDTHPHTIQICLPDVTVLGLMFLGAFFAVAITIFIISRTLAQMKEDLVDRSTVKGGDEMVLLRVLMSHLQSESMVQNIVRLPNLFLYFRSKVMRCTRNLLFSRLLKHCSTLFRPSPNLYLLSEFTSG
jgi:hypothetical protein